MRNEGSLGGLSADELEKLVLSVGTQRSYRPLSPVEVAGMLGSAKKHGATNPQLADVLHLNGPSMLGRFLKLNRLAPAVQAMVDWGASSTTLGFSTASEIAKLPEREQALAAQAAVRYSFSRTEAKDLVQLRERSGMSLAECISEVVATRPRVEYLDVYVGSVDDGSLREHLRGMSQVERDALLREALEGDAPEFAGEVSVRLTASNFILSAPHACSSVIDARYPNLEAGVTSLLARKVNRGV